MRGTDVMQEPLFTTVQLETFVPKDHPVRALRVLMDEALNELNGLFDAIYADGGRESIPPERLLRAQLLQVLYSIRSERQLCEQLQYNLLFRWFVGLPIEAATGSGTAPVDGFGHLLAWTDGNNVSTVMGYDQATGAPVGISAGIGQSSAVQSLIYSWDGYGNLEERQDANRSLSETFENDDLNRLTQSIVTNPANTGTTTKFSYDAMGNILTKTQQTSTGTTTNTYADEDSSHPYAVTGVTDASGTVYSASYDANGNMMTRNGSPITWTVDNMPDSIAAASGSSTFSYGPEHDRYQQVATDAGTTTTTTYIGSLFEVIATATDTQYRHMIVADGQVIAVHTIDESGTATTSYLHYDHLGSVDTITNDQGTVAQSMSFDAFGLRRDATNWDYDLTSTQIAALKSNTDRGYTYQEQLDNVGLIHMNGRVYDPGIGRFISADPTIPDPLYSQSFNRYSYVYNGPLEYTDPSGFVCGANDGTEACNEVDGGGGGYQTGGDTGDAGPDSEEGGGGDDNQNFNPSGANTSTWQIGKVTVNCNVICQLNAFLQNCSVCFSAGVLQLTGPTNPGLEGPGQENNGTGPSSPGTKPSSQTPQQKPQPPKQSCNQNVVNGANITYDFGASMQITAGAGMLLASPAIETPPGAALEIAGGLVATGGVILQGTAAVVLYQETGDTTPLVNSTIGIGISDTLDLSGMPQPVNVATNMAVGNILGGSSASCPGP